MPRQASLPMHQPPHGSDWKAPKIKKTWLSLLPQSQATAGAGDQSWLDGAGRLRREVRPNVRKDQTLQLKKKDTHARTHARTRTHTGGG